MSDVSGARMKESPMPERELVSFLHDIVCWGGYTPASVNRIHRRTFIKSASWVIAARAANDGMASANPSNEMSFGP